MTDNKVQPDLRPAIPADVAEILRLIRALAVYENLLPECTVTEAELQHALFGPQPRIHATLAELAGTPVGLALYYYTFHTFKARPNIVLDDLIVDPEHRGHGIGLALMRHLAQRAVAENCRRIEWRVLNWNQPAIDFYQRLGAEPVNSSHARQIGDNALAALAKGLPHG
jgi:GNAT superfamily N-acetyltransferase